MSFILDALKKADRERDLTRVPSLTTIHVPIQVTGRRVALWAAAGIALVGGGLSIWLLRPWSAGPPPPADSRVQTPSPLPASTQQTAGTPASARAGNTPAALKASTPPEPGAAEQREVLRQPESQPLRLGDRSGSEAGSEPEADLRPSGWETAPGRRPTQDSPPRSSGSEPMAATSGGIRGGGGRSGAGQIGESQPSPPPQPDPTLIQQPPVSQPAPVLAPAPVPAPAPAQPPPPPQAQPSPQVNRPAAPVVSPSPPAASPNPPTLVDAMAKMKLDLFVYTDVPADRMVIINGRRYLEGEQVDGLYLIERITKEGALLSYHGEKLLLRP